MGIQISHMEDTEPLDRYRYKQWFIFVCNWSALEVPWKCHWSAVEMPLKCRCSANSQQHTATAIYLPLLTLPLSTVSWSKSAQVLFCCGKTDPPPFFWKLCHHMPILGIHSLTRGLHNTQKCVFHNITKTQTDGHRNSMTNWPSEPIELKIVILRKRICKTRKRLISYNKTFMNLMHIFFIYLMVKLLGPTSTYCKFLSWSQLFFNCIPLIILHVMSHVMSPAILRVMLRVKLRVMMCVMLPFILSVMLLVMSPVILHLHVILHSVLRLMSLIMLSSFLCVMFCVM